MLETVGEFVTWAVFKWEFMRKYFLEDVLWKKEIEFLELKQGSSSLTKFAAKFVKLVKLYPHYSEETTEFSTCIEFEYDLHT